MNMLLIIIASLIFFASEMSLLIVKKSTAVKNNDKYSLLLFWITIPLSISLGFFLANYHEWNQLQQIIAIMGLVVFVTGLIIRWVSIIQLKKEFTVNVSIQKSHELKTDGIYKYARHPSYFGLLLVVFGLALGMNSVWSLLVVVIPIYLALRYRIKVEETILFEQFGKDYQKYYMTTSSMFPFRLKK